MGTVFLDIQYHHIKKRSSYLYNIINLYFYEYETIVGWD